jgi:hypothetical protein
MLELAEGPQSGVRRRFLNLRPGSWSFMIATPADSDGAQLLGEVFTVCHRLLSIQPHLTQSCGLRLNPSVSWTS